MYHTSHDFNIHSLGLSEDSQSYYVDKEAGSVLYFIEQRYFGELALMVRCLILSALPSLPFHLPLLTPGTTLYFFEL